MLDCGISRLCQVTPRCMVRVLEVLCYIVLMGGHPFSSREFSDFTHSIAYHIHVMVNYLSIIYLGAGDLSSAPYHQLLFLFFHRAISSKNSTISLSMPDLQTILEGERGLNSNHQPSLHPACVLALGCFFFFFVLASRHLF